MSCPDDDFLTRFVQDPDAALSVFPEFESHLGGCFQCQERIEGIASQQGDQLLQHVFGDNPEQLALLPQVKGYRILENVGEGGHGSVYRAVQVSTGREVAIKFTYNNSPSFARRFEGERNALMRSDHPHIVSLIDAAYAQNGYYFVYPWMDCSLSTWIKSQEVVPIDRALEIVSEVASAVQHLHSIGILHRDLKPSNVLLSSSGQTKLTDFGIAKEFAHDNPSSTATLPLGTPGYMAPEQTGLVAEEVGFQTDVYGLGALFYCLLTGRPPFIGGNIMQTVQYVVTEDPIAPRSLRPDVPVDCETICLKCLSKSKEDRYESAQEFLSDLRRFQRGEPIRAKPASSIRKAKHWIRKHPRASAFALSAIAFSLLGLVLSFWVQRQWLEASQRASILTIVEKLKSCDSFELPSVFQEIDQIESFKLDSVLSQVSADNDVQRLRLWLASQQPDKVSINQALSGVVDSRLRDLPTIRPRIKRLLSEVNRDSQAPIEIGNQFSDPEHLLRVVSVLPVGFLAAEPRTDLGDKLVLALRTRPESESRLWSQCLLEYASEISGSLVRQLESLTTAQRGELDTVVSTVLRWTASSPELTLRILERATVDQLRMANQIPELFSDDLLELSRQRWEYLNSLHSHSLIGHNSDSEFQDSASDHPATMEKLLLDFEGLATAESGFLLKVPSSLLDNVFSNLHGEGYRAISFQPYKDDGQQFFTLTFKRSGGKNSISEKVSIEQLQTVVAQQKLAGWQPVAVWPDDQLSEVAVLWQEVGEFDSQITSPPDGLVEWVGPFPEGFSAGMSRCLTAFYTDAGSLGLDTFWSSPPSTDDFPNFPIEGVSEYGKTVKLGMTLGSRRVGRQVRHSQRQVSQHMIHPCSKEDFLRKARAWLGLGILPQDVFVDQESMQYAAFLELDHTAIERVDRCRAMGALVCWMCGDSHPVLEEFKTSRLPSGRTLVINAIADIDRSPQRWLSLYGDSLDADQLYSWLIAGSNFNWENGDRTLVELVERWIVQLSRHPDSAVALTAGWILDRQFGKPVTTTTSTMTPPVKHRAWYYSPSGIPFVLIDTDDVHFVTDDSKIPWNRDIFCNAVELHRVIAVSAIEIPQEFFEQFLQANSHSTAPVNLIEDGLPNIPTFGIDYWDALRFCRWLSEREGIAEAMIGLPPIEAIEPMDELLDDDIWSAALLEKDGYRLPTGKEWQIICRSGTITSSFLGESDEYLSRYAWNSNNTPLTPMPVARLAPSPWGFFDILGNVYEMNLGGVTNHYEESLGNGNLNFGVRNGTNIIVRGGSFLSNRAYCIAGAVHGIPAASRDRNTGFRIVRTLRFKEKLEEIEN